MMLQTQATKQSLQTLNPEAQSGGACASCCKCKKLRHWSRNLVQWRGSVFPHSFLVALPCAVCTAAIRVAMDYGIWESTNILENSAIWNGFTFLVGFLIFFRTSQAYQRFWDGCTATHTMRLEWFEACSSLVSYCRHSTANVEEVECFQQLLVRLFSVLHAAALAEVEDSSTDIEGNEAFKYSLLDIRAIDRASLRVLMEADDKVGLLLQWIQHLVVDHMKCGVLSIPAPLVTHACGQLFNGVVAFHEAIKIASIPFPYRQMCDILLILLWLGTPVVTAQWVDSPAWGALFGFVLIFVYWCLNMIATDIENPFGHDSNDIDGEVMQREMNRSLQMLLEPITLKTPTLRTNRRRTKDMTDDSLNDIWQDDAILEGQPLPLEAEVLCKPKRSFPRTREVVFREPNNPKSRARLKETAALRLAHGDTWEESNLGTSEMSPKSARSQPPTGTLMGCHRLPTSPVCSQKLPTSDSSPTRSDHQYHFGMEGPIAEEDFEEPGDHRGSVIVELTSEQAENIEDLTTTEVDGSCSPSSLPSDDRCTLGPQRHAYKNSFYEAEQPPPSFPRGKGFPQLQHIRLLATDELPLPL